MINSPETHHIPAEGVPIEAPKRSYDADFEQRDPELAASVIDTIAGIETGLIPGTLQEKLFRAFSPSLQRSLVAEISGLDASVLAMFKQQLELMDNVLQRIFNQDGSTKPLSSEMDLTPKEALQLSVKINQMAMKELPKIYSVDRQQRFERALEIVMDRYLTPEQQEEFLIEVDRQSVQS